MSIPRSIHSVHCYLKTYSSTLILQFSLAPYAGLSLASVTSPSDPRASFSCHTILHANNKFMSASRCCGRLLPSLSSLSISHPQNCSTWSDQFLVRSGFIRWQIPLPRSSQRYNLIPRRPRQRLSAENQPNFVWNPIWLVIPWRKNGCPALAKCLMKKPISEPRCGQKRVESCMWKLDFISCHVSSVCFAWQVLLYYL